MDKVRGAGFGEGSSMIRFSRCTGLGIAGFYPESFVGAERKKSVVENIGSTSYESRKLLCFDTCLYCLCDDLMPWVSGVRR